MRIRHESLRKTLIEDVTKSFSSTRDLDIHGRLDTLVINIKGYEKYKLKLEYNEANQVNRYKIYHFTVLHLYRNIFHNILNIFTPHFFNSYLKGQLLWEEVRQHLNFILITQTTNWKKLKATEIIIGHLSTMSMEM